MNSPKVEQYTLCFEAVTRLAGDVRIVQTDYSFSTTED